ncbi:hypothetical protein TVAG_336830 [Trichomonas vaginalis G3]|uniref:Uncharacterized protein n=1 Tax=Trichomonas vaginalis (strain ATCC PRA-98 / G3) TaxID=412133 RepID=A2EPV3_TRIV3|nr:guanylate cyclase protein [Trichomonas vaginalis G3]EAY05291.1 hypothetical protein TVAG_336830 [Trichomonas vaginalis G3]KAI5531876.1 guanylate cyclase protein [Trichomonas vaginalis G3]|eukprot:XP_001317514.1 hypothetical protein [Trichomonas vaginalis G3]
MNQPSSVHTSTTFDGDTGYRQKLIQGDTQFVDRLFPLFTSIFQKCKVSIWFTYLTIGFWGLQTLFISTWPMSRYWLESNSSAGFSKIYRYLNLIFLFVDTKDYAKGLYAKELVFIILNAISFVLVLTQLLYYNVHRRFINLLLGPIQLFDSITLIGIIPSSFAFGKLFLKGITSELEVLEVFAIVFAVINVIYEIVYHMMSLKLFSRTVALQNTPAMSFDPTISIYIMNTSALHAIVAFIISYFSDWAYLIILIVQIVAYAYYFSYSLNMVYLVIASNCVVSALMIACIIEDIYMIIAYASPKMPHGVPILFGIISFNVFVCVMFIVFKLKRKKISKLLKEYDHEQFEDINSYYDSLGILKNDKRTTMFLSVGFAEACPLFTDLSLFEYLLLREPSDQILIIMIQIINFFPGESRLLSRMTMMLMAKRSLTFEQRFLIYQVYKVKTLRQFSSSSDSQIKLNELKNMSRTIETITRSSLDNTNLKSSFFEALSIKAKRAHAIWREAMVDYPNNPKFCNEYCRYLVEAESNFPESLEIKNRENMIEMGKNYSFDFSFVSMVRVFPVYLKKEILDLKGNIKVKASNNRASSSSENSSNNSGSQGSGTFNSNDIDDEVLNSLGKATLSHYKPRLALHHALENKLPKPITCLIHALLIVVVIVIFFLLFLFFFNEVKLKDQTGSMAMLDAMSKARFYIAINDMEILLRYFVDRGNYSYYKPAIDSLNDNCDVNETMVNTSNDYLLQSAPNLKNAMIYFEDLIEEITILAITKGNVSSVAGSLMMEVHPIYTCADNGYPIYIVNDSISTMISIFFVEQAYILTKIHETIGNLLSTKQFCEMISNLRYFYWLAPQVFTDFCDFQIKEGDLLAKKFKIIMITVPLCTALVLFVPIIVLYIGIIRSLKKVTEILNSFDPKVRQDAKELMSVNIDNDDIKFSDINPSSNRSSLYIF